MAVTIRDGWLSGSLPDDTGREWPIVQHRQSTSRPSLAIDPPNLCLHTTETDGYVFTLRYPSQWQCGDGVIGQHIRLGNAGDAVNDHDALLEQIEMVGRSRLQLWLPDESTLGPTVALVAWLHKTNRIKTGIARPTRLDDFPVVLDRGPQAVEGYYRRMVPTPSGVYGHVDIAGNSHWDPGSFDYPRFFARVRAVLDGGANEEDEMFKEWKTGWDRHEAGRAFDETWPAQIRQGWRDRAKVLADAKAAAPAGDGSVPSHTHSWDGNITVA